LAFLLAYTPLSNVASAVGSRSSTLIDHLDVEIVGAKALPSGAQRGGLLRISDLGRLALLGADVRSNMREAGGAALLSAFPRAQKQPNRAFESTVPARGDADHHRTR
jgi:hypothetical protein